MRPTRSLPLRPLLISTVAAALVTLSVARAQPPNPFGPTPRTGTQGAPPSQARRAPTAAAVIARVEGRPITQEAFDRMAGPYFQQVRAQLGEAFDERMRATASRNVLEELIRRDVLMVIAQRRRIPVTDQDVDRLLRQDPSFLTNGKFDQAKLTQFKFSPGSNYAVLLPHLRELAAAARLDSASRSRLKPTRAALREEWSKRHEQVRFRFLALALRDAPLDPEATEVEQASYYVRHPELFRSKPRANLRYLGLSLPTVADSLHASAEAAALSRARRMTDSLRAGTPLESLAVEPSEVEETGFLNVPATRLPRLGSVPELLTALARAETDTARRILPPVLVGNRVIISEIAGVQPSHLSPFSEVRAEVKRLADLDKRRTSLDADRRAWFAAHPDSFRTLCVKVIRVVMEDSTRAARVMPGVLAGWTAGRDLRTLARAAGARVETLSIVRGGTPDSLFTPAITDSILADAPATGARIVHGPRRFGARTALWRVDALQPDCVPAFDAVRPRADQLFQAEKRRRDVEQGREYFEAHRAAYRSGPRRVVDYIAVKVPPLDSVRVSEPDQRAYYAAHLDQYRREEEVRARHILILTRPDPTPAGASRAEALADSLLRLIRGGADFADLARRFSQDPGSAPQGGDLGFFPRGRMVPEFNDSSFALKPGQVSGLVKTTYGYHIIKVEERHEAGLRNFDEVRPTIQNLLAQAGADSMARRKAESLRRRIARGAPVAVLALESDSLRTSPPFAAGAPIASVGWVEGLFEDLAAVPEGRWAPRVYRAGSSYLVVRNGRLLPEGPAPFEEVKTRAIEDMRSAKRHEFLEQRIAAIRAGLAAGATLDSLAAPYGGLKDSGFLTRVTGSVPGLGVEPRVIGAAFALEPGHVTDTLATAVGVTWIRTEEKRSGPGADYEKDAAALELELLGEAYAAWLDREKQTMKIEILRPDLRPAAAAAAPPGATSAPKRGAKLR